MKNKVISMLLATALAVTMLAGCGSAPSENSGAQTSEEGSAEDTKDNKDTGSTGSSEASQKPVTLKTVSMFGGTDPNGEVYQAINQEIMEEYDYIKIEDNSQVSDEDWKAAVAADFSVGNEPDVLQFFTDATADSIVATDRLVSFDEIKKEYPDYAKDIFEDSLKAAANTDGVMRAVPTTGYWEGLFCNKKLFEENNIEIPTDWASLETAIKAFKEKGITPISCSLNNVPHYWLEFMMLYSAGAEEFTSIPETAPEGWIKGVEMFKTLREMGAFPEDTDTVDDAYTAQLFVDGKTAMLLDGSWTVGKITDTDNTVVVPFPGVPDQKVNDVAMIGGVSSGFYITKKAWDDPDKRDAAVKFVMAHTSQSAIQRYWEITGAVTQAAAQVTPIEDVTPFAKSIGEYTSSVTTIVGPTDSRIGDAYKTLTANIVKVSTGAMSAEDAINEALDVYKQQ